MKKIVEFLKDCSGSIDNATPVAVGGIVGAIAAVYAFSGIDVHAIRPVLEPLLNHVGLVWPR